MIHRGEILRNAVYNSGIPISKIAVKIGKSRRFLYDLFENQNVPLDYMIQIGKVISVDFTSVVSELKEKRTNQPTAGVDWKTNYYELLEKYSKLLETGIEEYFVKQATKK